MFIKVTKSGPRRYVQLVEAYRDETGRPKQRTVATLGRLDQLGDSIKSMHEGLSRILGVKATPVAGSGTPQFESSRALGDVWVLTQIWKQLGLDRLRQVLKQRTRHRIDLEALLRVMVINRLCDADFKLGTLRWVKTVSLPNTSLESVNHQQLLRTMDALLEHQDVIDRILADAVRPLVSEDLSVVFYDMTTIRVEGLTEATEDLRKFGKSKEGGITRQFMLGLVQTAEGIPLYHEVFPGNTAEVGTLKTSLLKVLERFPIQRVIAVADRGLLSLDNLEELQNMVLPSGAPLEFILAVPGRRYNEFADLLATFNQRAQNTDESEVVGEEKWNSLRLVVAHDRIRAHAYICFIALVLARVMRERLYQNPVPDVCSPERALSVLRRIQTHKVTFDGQAPVTGISAIDAEQTAVLTSLKVKKPTPDVEYVNL